MKTGAEGLRYQVERLLDSVDAVCYVLDYTKLRTAEEASNFARLKCINPGLIKRLSRRYACNIITLLLADFFLKLQCTPAVLSRHCSLHLIRCAGCSSSLTRWT